MIEYIFLPQTIEALGWTLVHSFWQGAAFAMMLAVILIVLKAYSANTRYIVSVGMICAFFIAISATFWQQWQLANIKEINAIEFANNYVHIGLANNDLVRASDYELIYDVPISNASPSSKAVPIHLEFLKKCKNYFNKQLPLLVSIWLFGILLLQVRFLGRLVFVQRLKHYGTQLFPEVLKEKVKELELKLRVKKAIAYRTSNRITSPMVIGWIKPFVLLPKQLIESLSESELYAVLAHELAHIKREDFIVNLIQITLCNIFFFHPGIWWMSSKVDEEREHCCDDLAIEATGTASSYAKTLISVSELQLTFQSNSSLTMALSGKNKNISRSSFSTRIKRLFEIGNGVGTFRENLTTAGVLVMIFCFSFIAMGSTVKKSEDETKSSDEEIASEIDHSETTSDIESTNNVKTIDQPRNQIQSVASINKISQKTIHSIVQNEITSTKDNMLNNHLLASEPIYFENVIEQNTKDSRIESLMMACFDGDLTFVKSLLQLGIDINGIGEKGFTPLMVAVSKDRYQVVKYLIEQGADVNKNINGWSPLLEAADEGSTMSMELLIEAGAELNYFWTVGSPTAMTMAASEGHLDCMKMLQEAGASINGYKNSVPPLHSAAEEGNTNIISYLIRQGVDINKQDYASRTALMFAASEGHKEIVTQLLKAGADPSITDKQGHNAQLYAESQEEFEIVKLLNNCYGHDNCSDSKSSNKNSNEYKKDPYNLKPIHIATIEGKIEKVESMVNDGADINTRDDYGRTALHFAAAKNHTIDMRILIGLGANINAQDNQGRTPLMYAAADGKKEAVVLLVSNLAEVNISDVDGMRAFEWSQVCNNKDLHNFLKLITEHANDKYSSMKISNEELEELQKEMKKEIMKEIKFKEKLHINEEGTHLRQLNIENEIPEFYKVVSHGTVAELSQMRNDGLNLNVSDDTGQTPLMVAALFDRIDMANYLIGQNVDVNMSSNSGLTALHYAALQNNNVMTLLLLDNGAKVDPEMRYSSTDGNFNSQPYVWEYQGATPLLIAVESGNMEVAKVLINYGANKHHRLVRNEFLLNKNRRSYLYGNEVMGIDLEFLEHAKLINSDKNWSPLKQAKRLNDPAILALFTNK